MDSRFRGNDGSEQEGRGGIPYTACEGEISVREKVVATVGAEASLSSPPERAIGDAERQMVNELTSFRRGRRLGEGLTIRRLIAEGRR